MATRGRKPASRRTAPKAAQPKTIDLKASDTQSAAGSDPDKGATGRKADPKKSVPEVKSEKFKSAAPKAGVDAAKTQSAEEKARPDSKLSSPEEKKDERASGSEQKQSTQNREKLSAPTPQKKSGFGAMAASAILGGLVTAGGLGVIGQSETASSLPIIGSLYSDKSEDDGSATVNDLQNRLAELTDKINRMETAGPAENEELFAKLDERVEKLEQINANGSDSAQTLQSNSEAIKQLSQQLADLADGIPMPSSSTVQPAIDELNSTLSALTAQVDAIKDRSAEAAGAQLQQISEKLNSVTLDLNAFKQSANSSVNELMTELSGKISAAQERVDGLEKTLTEQVISRMDEVVSAADKATSSEKIARSVAVSSLQSAIENGTSYLNAINSIETLGGASEETRRLKELASIGDIPTNSQLQSSFDNIASQLVNRGIQAEEKDGLLNRFVTSARSLVSVRPSGPQEGSSPGAVVSRIEANLKDGKLGAVIDEWGLLPEERASIGQKWIEGVKLRHETNQLLELVLNQANGAKEQG